MRRTITTLATLAIVGTLAYGAHAADSQRAQGYLDDAKKSLEKGDNKSAVIQLKNAVQADPDNGAARFQLGAVEMRLGDFLSAEKELRAALEHDFDRDRTSILLAEVMLRVGKNQQLLDEMPPGDRPKETEAGIRVARGYALLALKKPADAMKSFQDALTLTAKPARAQLGLARALAGTNDLAGAAEAAQKAIDEDNTVADAWAFLAQVKRTQGDAAGARAAFDKALEINPNSESARDGRASLLIATNDLKLAEADIKQALKTNPKASLANFLMAQLQAKQQNFRGAEATLIALKGFVDAYPPALYLLAAVNAAQNEMAQAEENINHYLALVPNDETGTALLANILVKRDNLPRAIEALKKASDAHPDSVRLLGLLSDAYARNKQPNEAAAVLDKASNLDSNDPEMKTRIAAQWLRIGRPEEAISDLESATELSPKSSQAGLLLVLTLLQQNKVDEALKAAEELHQRVPEDPVAENLIGAITLKKGDLEEARKHFQNALTLKADFTPASINLAQLATAERKFDDARAIYEGILKRDPVNLAALMAEADLSFSQGNTADGLLWLEKARNGNADAVPPRLRLIDIYLSRKDTAKASEVAAELDKIAPNDPAAVNAVGEVHLAANEIQPALASFQKVQQLAPNTPRTYLQLARAHYALKDMDATRTDVEKAAELGPTDSVVQQQFIRFAIETNTVPQELTFLNKLADRQKQNTAYDLFVGDMLVASGQVGDAVTAYTKGLAKNPDDPGAITKLAAAQGRTDPTRALDTLSKWLQKHPDATNVRFVYASMLLGAKHNDEAIAEHEAVLKADPTNVAAMNNLAWLYEEKGDKRALDLAQRAHLQNPNSADVTDTLAWILVKQGQSAEAVPLLAKIVTLPDVPPEVRYHYAVALKNTGNVKDARVNLEEALKAKQFDGMADAQALMKQLSGG